MGKLTYNQISVLRAIADNRGASFTAYTLGRVTCKALLARGLISVNGRIDRFYGDPFVHITDAGRSEINALARQPVSEPSP